MQLIEEEETAAAQVPEFLALKKKRSKMSQIHHLKDTFIYPTTNLSTVRHLQKPS